MSHSMNCCQRDFNCNRCRSRTSGSDVGTLCGKPAVAKCADCGTAICSDCCEEYCGDSFCGQCYEYHVANSCVSKAVHNENQPSPFGYRKQGQSKPLTPMTDFISILVPVSVYRWI